MRVPFALLLIIQSVTNSQPSPVSKVLAAIQANDAQLALRLLDDVTDVNVDKGALLQEAVMHRQAEVIEKLFAKGADPNLRDDLLVNTVLNKWDSTTLLLLRHGANPNQHSPYGGESPLSVASSQGNTTVMRALIEKGADVNYNDYVGSGTALIAAIEKNQYGAIRLLLDKEADPSIDAKFHGYPWNIAKRSKNEKIRDLLKQHRSNCKEQPEHCQD